MTTVLLTFTSNAAPATGAARQTTATPQRLSVASPRLASPPALRGTDGRLARGWYPSCCCIARRSTALRRQAARRGNSSEIGEVARVRGRGEASSMCRLAGQGVEVWRRRHRAMNAGGRILAIDGLAWNGAAATVRDLALTESPIGRVELSEIIRRDVKAAILELLTEAPESPRQVNYARLAWLQAASESAAYLTNQMQGAVDLVSAPALLQHAFSLATVDGLVLEFGVFSGTSLRLLSSLTDQDVHGFDSFEGLPEDWTYFQKRGRFSRDGQLPEFDRPNVRLHKGWFDETLPRFLETIDGPVRFLHVDCDLYSSTVTVLQALTPRIVPGTVIVFDEYVNYPGWQQHEQKAFFEFLQQTGLRYRYVGFASSAYSVAVQIL
jgi:hypothetical protein